MSLMAPITISIPHNLGKAEARSRLESGFGRVRQQFAQGGAMNMQESWDGDRLTFSMKAMGQTVSGRLDVLESEVKMEVDLPNIFAAIAGTIKKRVQREGALLLEDKRRAK